MAAAPRQLETKNRGVSAPTRIWAVLTYTELIFYDGWQIADESGSLAVLRKPLFLAVDFADLFGAVY